MAAGRMPLAAEVCTDAGCGHAHCDATRDLVSSRCGLCGEVIGFGRLFFQQAGWRLLGHHGCVLDDPDGWLRLATTGRAVTC